jgi:HD-GYP domain-containing protein (c-di-GMP phosphodiesterase class II)/GGDEF domain-containing protein
MATVVLALVALALALALAVALRRLRERERAGRLAVERARDEGAAEQRRLAADNERIGARLEAAGAERDRLVAERDRLADRHEHLHDEVKRARSKLKDQSDALTRLRRAWQAEREWSRELRTQIARLGGGVGRSAERATVPELVLEAAIKLCAADRGLMLSREDADADGELDLLVARGFEHDPADSAVAQRFAREVLERDEIIRQDAPAGGDAGTPADAEIESLVAIPVFLHDRFNGVVVCANRPGGFAEMDDDVLLALGDHAGAALQHGALRHRLDEADRATVRCLVEAVAVADPVRQRESGELVPLAVRLADGLRLSAGDRETLIGALFLRDVGHLGLPHELLQKPGALTIEERALVRLHPHLGFEVLAQEPALREVATIVLHHHERYDGGGYPAGLGGEEIPLLSRVLTVLDAYGAMTHARSFRAALPSERACSAVLGEAGAQFDPAMADLLVDAVRREGEAPNAVLALIADQGLALGEVTDTPGPPFYTTSLDGTMPGGLATDGLTLLGDQRALAHGVGEATRWSDGAGGLFALALIELDDLTRTNEECSSLVGDRLIRLAARHARRVAARVGGTPFRASGRRLAILAQATHEVGARTLGDEIALEFRYGPSVSYAVVVRRPGEREEELIARGRRALAEA